MVSSFSIITPFMIFCLLYVLVILEKKWTTWNRILFDIWYFLLVEKASQKNTKLCSFFKIVCSITKKYCKKKDGTCKALTGSKCIWLILIFFHSTENVEWQYVHNRDISFVKFRIKVVLRIWYENWIRLKTNAMHNISSYE